MSNKYYDVRVLMHRAFIVFLTVFLISDVAAKMLHSTGHAAVCRHPRVERSLRWQHGRTLRSGSRVAGKPF